MPFPDYEAGEADAAPDCETAGAMCNSHGMDLGRCNKIPGVQGVIFDCQARPRVEPHDYPPPPEPTPAPKSSNTGLILAGVGLLAAGGAYWWWKRRR